MGWSNLAATIKDIAALAGVSRATASRALGGYGYVSEEARKKVLVAAEKLRYKPHALAKSMVTGRTGTIALLVADIENPFFAKVARGVSDAITPDGYNLIVCSTNENLREEKLAIDGLCQKKVDGLILAPVSYVDATHLKELVDQHIPVVLVDRLVTGVEADIVAVTNMEGSYEAVRHLVQSGHERIGFLGDSVSTTAERLDGYRKALGDAGLAVRDEYVMLGEYSIESGYREAVSLLSGTNRPTAVFAASNFMTIGLLTAVKDMGISVPGELAVVGFDDMDWFQLTTPTITAVAQPVYELGRVAAQRLIRRIAGDATRPEITRLPTRLMIRESSGSVIRRIGS